MEQERPNTVFNKVGIAMCILVGFLLYIQVLIMIPVQLLKPEWIENINFLMALNGISYYVCAFPVFVFFMSTIKSKKEVEKRKLGVGKFLAYFFICFAAINLSNYVTVLFHTIIHATTGIELGSVLDDVLNKPDVIIVVTTVILAPIFEELTFRYLALNKLRRFGDKTAIIFTAVLFGLFHMNFEQGIYATAIGLVLGYVACKTGRIRYTILLHAMINFTSGILPLLVDELNSPIGTLVYTIGYFAFILIGIILFILMVSKVKLDAGTEPLPNPVKTAILNPGMLVFLVVCVGSMFLTLIMEFVGGIMK